MGELSVQRQKYVVDHQEAVVGISGNPANFVRRKAQVEGVHDPARGWDAKVALQMGMVVPAQGGDAITLLQTQRLQG